MIRQCAWCKLLLGQIAPLGDKSVSHGICKECEKKMMREMDEITVRAK